MADDSTVRFRTEFHLGGRCFRAFGNPGEAIVTVFEFQAIDERKRSRREREFVETYCRGMQEITGTDLEMLRSRFEIVWRPCA